MPEQVRSAECPSERSERLDRLVRWVAKRTSFDKKPADTLRTIRLPPQPEDGMKQKWQCAMIRTDVSTGTATKPPYLNTRKRSLIMGHGLSTYTAIT